MIVDPDPLVKEVQWREGRLGILLTPDRDPAMPPHVTRITDPNGAPALANVVPGDDFLSINGLSTTVLGYNRSLQMLKRESLPLTLRFRPRTTQGAVPPALPPAQPAIPLPPDNSNYTVTWADDGPLGMVFLPHEDNLNQLRIGRLTGEGRSAGLESAAEGDLLIAVNGEQTASLGYDSTIDAITTSSKPVTLLFQSAGRR